MKPLTPIEYGINTCIIVIVVIILIVVVIVLVESIFLETVARKSVQIMIVAKKSKYVRNV
jgi:hypothetical protein